MPPTLSESDASSLIRAHYEMQHGCFISHCRPTNGFVQISSKTSSAPMWNHSAWLEGSDQDLLGCITAEAEKEGSPPRRPVVYTRARNGLFEGAGFEEFDRETWMVYGGSGDLPSNSLRVVETSSDPELSDFIDVFYASYQIKDPAYAAVLRQPEKGGYDKTIRHFVGYTSEGPVCVTTVIERGNFACIYNVGTHPRARKRGYAGMLLSHLIESTGTFSGKILFLQVEQGSSAEKLYQRLGFSAAFVRVGYWLRNWNTSQARRADSALDWLGSTSSRLFAAQKVETSFRETISISADEMASIKKLAVRHGLDVEPILFSAWACLVARYSAGEAAEFWIRRPSSTQPGAEYSRFQLPFGKDVSVKSWIPSVKREFSRCLGAESVPWNEAAAALPGGEDNIENVLFTVNRGKAGENAAALFPLEISWHQENPRLEAVCRGGHFSKESARRICRHLLRILENMALQPESSVATLEMLTSRERQQLLVDWNSNPPVEAARSISALFEAQVERTPDAMALVAPANATEEMTQLTYRQLNRRANKLAHHLESLGIGAEKYVGVCLGRGADLIVSLLAILKTGAACVPLDPAYPKDRLLFILKDTGAGVVLTHKSLAESLPHHHARIVHLDADAPAIALQRDKNPGRTLPEGDIAYVIYTSGSTGQPKGVLIPNRAISGHCQEVKNYYGLSASDRVLQFSSFNFDASFEQILPPLISGAALLLRGNDVWSPTEFREKLISLGLTVADLPTAYFHQLAQDCAELPASASQSALRLAIVGGEALSPETVRLWRQSPFSGVRLINAYGPTETTITATTFEIPPGDATSPPLEKIPIGRPRGDRKLYILDRFGNPVPIAVPGELYIGGPLLARGYLNRKELTEEKFVPNPFSDDPAARLYRTGDLVRYVEDGNIEFLGRFDDQVKVRGFRIELGEVETVLKQHTGVREAVVMARQDGPGEKRLVAYCVLTPEAGGIRELRRHLQKRLPDFMIPAAFVLLEKLPLLPSGKIDRRALPAPDRTLAENVNVKGPKEPLELQIQLVFERILNRVPIGVDMSFFELGGDSLQALELIVEIERVTGRNLPLGTLYQFPTVESLAGVLQTQTGGLPWSALVPLQPRGRKTPLYLIHTTPGDILGYGNLVYHLGTDQPCYGFQSLGLKDAGMAHQRIEDMADYYNDLLRQFQPEGPYFLGGWCYGGIVAVEMARRLLKQGQRVALLALLETVALPPSLTNFRYYAHRIACSIKMSPSRWATYFREKIRYRREFQMANRMRFRQVDSGESASQGSDGTEKRLAILEAVYNANLEALRHYRSSPYPGKVTLFNAADRDPALIPDPKYGWAGLAQASDVHLVPGNHDTMLTEPHVAVLAKKLSQCLREAEQFHSNTPMIRTNGAAAWRNAAMI